MENPNTHKKKLMKEMDKFYKDQSAPSYRGNYDEID